MTLAQTMNVAPTRNAGGEMSYTYTSGTSTRLVWFTDNISINSKILLAKQYKLKGVALFKIDGDGDPLLWNTLK
jgi:spore germination protein YaaH